MKPVPALACLCLAVILFAACKKDKDDDKPQTKTEMLTSGKWQVASYKVRMDHYGSVTNVDFDDLDSCELDDYFMFDPAGTITVDQGAVQCDPGTDPQRWTSGNWMLMENDTKMRKIGALTLAATETDTVIADIITLNENLLQMHYYYEDTAQQLRIDVNEAYKKMK